MNIYSLFHELRKRAICVWYEEEKLKAFLPKNEKIAPGEKEFIDENKPEIIKILKSNRVFSKEDFLNRKIYKNPDHQGNWELSSAQERLWFIEQYEKGSSAYNIPMAFDLGNGADLDSFKKSITGIVTRHEVLRTVFRKDADGNDYQLVLNETVRINEERLREKDLPGRLRESINSVFDLVNEGPLKVLILCTEKSAYSLANVHHIAFDGWSREIFLRELEEFYSYHKEKRALKLPEPDIQYKDFALWQREYLRGDGLEKEQAFWKKHLAGYETLEFPIDLQRPSYVDYRGDDVHFELDEDLSAKLKSIAREKGKTLYTLLLSAFYILLNKYTGQESLVIGTPAANRDNAQLENLIGFFVNSLAIKADLHQDLTFEALLDEVQDTLIEAQKYQDLPFEKVVELLNVEKDQSRHPLFQIMFGTVSFGGNEEGVFKAIPLDNYYKPAKFDLSLFINEREKRLTGTFNYALSLFRRETIERLRGHFCTLLDQVARDSNCRIKDITILSREEYEKIVFDWNKTDAPCPEEKTIVDLFEEQAEKNPDNIAVIFKGEKLTFKELNERANQLAHTLRRDYEEYFGERIRSDTLIGIYIERSFEMITGILGILKSGAAYVPFDSADPRERLRFKINDCGCRMVITSSECVKDLVFLAETDTIPVALDSYADEISRASRVNPSHINRVTDLAYIIYTSGSTGRPKGVMLENRSVINYMENFKNSTEGGKKIADLSSSLSFDLTVTTTIVPLVTGNTIAVYPGSLKNINEYMKHIENNRVTFIKTVPSLLYLLLKQKRASSLKEIFVGGEKLNRDFLSNQEGLAIYDEYGPTEATVGTTLSNVYPLNQSGIGKPYNNYRVYILDGARKPVPAGVRGELFIGGDCLARGYLNRRELTEERFIDNPFVSEEERREGRNLKIYKTGDLARWLPDGNIEYVGRNDDQVKIRGFRVELGEIEERLSEHSSVEQCAVLCREFNGNKYLAAYYISRNKLPGEDLRSYLAELLPDYMVPSYFFRLDEMPLTVNGKIDRNALPEIGFRGNEENYAPPRNGTEELLCSLWQEVLGIEKVGINEDFFRLGGNSILAMKLSHKMTKDLRREIPVASLFDKRSIKGISDSLAGFKPLIAIEPYKGEKGALSFAQERLYFIEEYEGGSRAYNIPLLFELDKGTDIPALKKSIESIIRRHEVLRTVFIKNEKGEVFQKVLTGAIDIGEQNLAGSDFLEKVREDINIIFDLHKEYPVKVSFYFAESTAYLLINVHHIAFDGWSTDIFLKELESFYRYHKEGKTPEVPGLEIQYKDFAVWQREYLSGERLNYELDYWKRELEGYETLELPTDKPRPHEVDYQGDYFIFELDRELSHGLRAVVRDYGTTLYTIFLSAFYILLHKYSGQNDIVIGTPTANRDYSQLESLIGFFVNSTVMRCKLTSGLDIKSLIKGTSASLTAMQTHHDLPFEKLVELLNVPKDPSRHPLIQVMFSVQSFGAINEKDDTRLFKPVDVSGSYKISKYDLSLFIDDSKDMISCGFNYAVSLFEKERIEKMADHYMNILKHILSGENELIKDLQLLTPAEYDKIIYEWNETDSEYPAEKTIIELFEAQAKKTPENPALEFEGEELTYKELNERANQLAHTIRRDYNEYFGAPLIRDTLIGIYMERSIEMIAAILGILKSGAAYVPFDRADPEERLKLKINDCSCKMMVTSSTCMRELLFLTETDTLILTVDEYEKEIKESPVTNPPSINTSRDLAYLIYTSGSTGKPKGVMLEHYGVVNLVTSHKKSFNLGDQSRILQIAPVSFDASVSTMFCALLNGGRLCICTEEARKDVSRLCEFIVNQKIDLIDIPAKLLELFPEDLDFTHLKYIITAGEVCDKKTMDYWCDKVNLINAYGPTESTVCATLAVYGRDRSNTDIGKPIYNKKVYVLNSDRNPVPPGIPGELYIGGVGLARGYLNRREITEERFIINKFLQEKPPPRYERRMYKTGDVVRWLDDGNLEFIGRNDDQVKVHGYRIEPGEIEHRLSSLEGITLCAVKVYEREKNKYLSAYYTSSSKISEDKIRDYLSALLPDYMIPSYFVELDEFPLNTSGKIDRKALPAPDLKLDEAGYIAPRNRLEEKLCAFFQELLGLDRVGINDDFFRIGGDSIFSIQLSSVLRNAGLECAVKDIFKNPTVGKLAHHIASSEKGKISIISERGLLEGEFDLLPIQRWFFEKVRRGIFPEHNHWNQSFLLIVPELDVSIIKESVSALASHHDMLRATFSNGRQKYNREIAIPQIKVLDRKTLSDNELFERLTQWQSGFNIEKGPLWQIGYINGYEDGSARLYFAFHHLVVDAVSWRILFEDMARCYEGKALKEKRGSYRQWVNAIKHYRENNAEEKSYWENIIKSLPDYGEYGRSEKEPSHREVMLSKELTGLLIKEAHGAYSTEINDLLLMALACALKDWQGDDIQGITLEGHGRENIDPAIDHSHTVGWFTNIYPVKLELRDDMGNSIVSIKESLRRIPNKGVGWGAFCSYGEERRDDDLIDDRALPPITFNYLGQLVGRSKEDSWQFTGEPSGRSIDTRNSDTTLISINGIVMNERLKFQVTTRLGEENTEKFARLLEESLKKITEHCIDVKKKRIQGTYDSEDFEYIPYILLNKDGKSKKLVIMIHPDSGYEAYMATLYPALSSDIKVILVDNFYRKVYLRDGVIFQKYHFKEFKDLAEYYVKLLLSENRDLIAQSECSLAGYSFGSPIAFEMDRIFKEHSIDISFLYMIDPLLPNLLKTHHELDCFKWYKDYFPAPTTTPIAHFRCTVPDPSLPGYTEYFTDSEESSLKSIARDLEEIEINCFHTGILNNADFIRKFKEKVEGNLESKGKEIERRGATDSDNSAVESQIREILSKVTGLDMEKDFNKDENLFQSGCTSIQTLSVLAMINEKYDINLTLSDIIKNFTIRGLASSIMKAGKAGQSIEVWEPVLFKSKAREAENLYFFPGLIGSVSSYSRICASLSGLFNVIFLEPKGMYGTMAPYASYDEAISCHVGEITKRDPGDSHIYLAGHSVGAVHSLDVALALEEKGYGHVNLINVDGYLHKMESVKESIGSENLDEALLGVIKIFFKEGRQQDSQSEAIGKDPLQEIASILFPDRDVSRDHALRVALGYRNIWHQQINDMIAYREPSQKFRGNALVFITRESGEKIRNNILKSCAERYEGEFKVNYISGDHLSCITDREHIEELHTHIHAWRKSHEKLLI